MQNPFKVTPWSLDEAKKLSNVLGICFDIDDTFSSEGKILPEAFSALWALKQAGFVLVPVTGRPAGWCDHIIRFWPVDAVVGENGAFVFYMEENKRKRLSTPGVIVNAPEELKKLHSKILSKFPNAELASDQAYREYDLAIDFCEDVPAWKMEDVLALRNFCLEQGAQAKVSSIHVNTWFGNYDKVKGFKNWLEQGCLGVEQSKKSENLTQSKNWLYLGDSPNDEPMFEVFENSIGVANLKNFLPQLKTLPQWMTISPAGRGFQEAALAMIEAKR